jgi:poly(beta-D-mannuronate) lyase
VYDSASPLVIKVAGQAGKPITIAAETVGGVELTGGSGFKLIEPAAYVVVSGFKFTDTAGQILVGAGTSHVRFTRNTFQCTGNGAYILDIGDDAEIDYNEFADKKTTGNMIAVGGAGSQVARRLWIHHNYLHDFTASGTANAEMLRFGVATVGLSKGEGVVEYNLFARCRGENDLLSNRSSDNTYRYNTFIDSPTSQVTLRHGNDCLVYGNYLRNTEGLRIFGDRHQVFSNYCEGNYIGINIGNGSQEPENGAVGAGHVRPDDCVIAFNTLVDNRTHYQLSRREPEPLGARGIVFAYNILAGGETAVKIEGPYRDPVWKGNLLWHTEPGAIPAEGFTQIDPLLVAGPDGVKHVQPGSPAIAAAVDPIPSVTVDMDGQPRPEKKTVGADEISDAPVCAHLLTPSEVGPAAFPAEAAPKSDDNAKPPPPATLPAEPAGPEGEKSAGASAPVDTVAPPPSTPPSP